jgi:hypothetical protein
MEGEQRMVALQQKLLKAQEEEVKRKQEHEKLVQERRRAEIEKKKQRSACILRCVFVCALCHAIYLLAHPPTTPIKSNRDKELQLQLEEEQRNEREIHRRDAALKDKLAAEARVCSYV